MISAGVFAGAAIPCQPSAAYPGTTSATAGTFGNSCDAGWRGDSQSPKFIRPDVVNGRNQRIEHDVNMTAEKIGERSAAAAVRHVQHVDAAHLFEHLAIEMLWRSDAARTHAKLAGICFCVGDQLAKSFRGKRGLHDNNANPAIDAGNGRQVSQQIELEIVEERDIPRIDGGQFEQRVSVGWSTNHEFGCDVARCTDMVFDDDRLAELLRKPLTDHAADEVWRCPGLVADDQAYWPGWIVLRR